MNNALIIEWDALRCGEFPIDIITNCGCSVTSESMSAFKRKVTIATDDSEPITPELAFYMGMMVQSVQR